MHLAIKISAKVLQVKHVNSTSLLAACNLELTTPPFTTVTAILSLAASRYALYISVGVTSQISNVLYPGNNTISLSFGTNNTISSGVGENQAQFYSTAVSIQQYSSVLLSISATGSSLDTYIQKNTVAGNSGCYSSWFQCQRQVSNNNPCVVQGRRKFLEKSKNSSTMCCE